MALHETGVLDTIVSGVDANAALALLHNNCKDETRIDASFASNFLNAAVDVACFFVGVVARCSNENLVETPAGE